MQPADPLEAGAHELALRLNNPIPVHRPAEHGGDTQIVLELLVEQIHEQLAEIRHALSRLARHLTCMSPTVLAVCQTRSRPPRAAPAAALVLAP